MYHGVKRPSGTKKKIERIQSHHGPVKKGAWAKGPICGIIRLCWANFAAWTKSALSE